MSVTSEWTSRPAGSAMLAAVALVLAGCAQVATEPAISELELRDAIAVAFARAQVSVDASGRPARADSLKEPLESYYRARDYDPLWVGAGGLGERGTLLYDRLSHAEREALSPDSYDVAAIGAAAAAGDAAGLASADILLSRGLVRYAGDLGGDGAHDPGVLAEAARAADFAAWLDGLAPADAAYRRLRSALADYRSIAAAGGWPSIPPGPKIEEGDSDLRVAALRNRLAITGDLARRLADGSPLYDSAVTEAVKRFQARHGLEPDGITGDRTLAALNRRARVRVGQLETSLRDIRGPDFRFGGRGIVVNIAAAEVTLVEDGKAVLASRVIIGTPDRPTPTLRSTVTAIEFNPPWVVPVRIALEEIVPKVRSRGEAYLQRQGFRVFDSRNREVDAATVDWASLGRAGMPYVLRQDPGPLNPLGRVKFLFANRYSVYLHDTPARSLFERADRTLSHGCVRVEAAQRLALHLLKQEGWTDERFRQALDRGTTLRVPLRRPIPVHLVSLSAWVDEDGTVHFHDDPYAPPGTVDVASADAVCPADAEELRNYTKSF